MKPVKTRNGRQWTEARFNSFVKSALRGAQWPPKYAAIKDAFVENGTNPKTGRQCKLHRCYRCDGVFPQNQMHADHIVPVVGPEGFQDWNTFISRLYVEKEGFRAICKACHKLKSGEENAARRLRKKQ